MYIRGRFKVHGSWLITLSVLPFANHACHATVLSTAKTTTATTLNHPVIYLLPVTFFGPLLDRALIRHLSFTSVVLRPPKHSLSQSRRRRSTSRRVSPTIAVVMR
ncbi:unnamed protein product [Periconia digitata]|uniref:Secreted protein n=1 Tax=Periconia digitata TaxID=1303443 RepID=A0A9W4USW7_9PLEO|nr:unnamed protein product [Periconia digitata]